MHVDLLRAEIGRAGVFKFQVAELLGISRPFFSKKLKEGNFTIDEVNKMIEFLKIKHPERVFFDKGDDRECEKFEETRGGW